MTPRPRAPAAGARRGRWRGVAELAARALLLKDLRLELRTRDTAVAMVLFAVWRC